MGKEKVVLRDDFENYTDKNEKWRRALYSKLQRQENRLGKQVQFFSKEDFDELFAMEGWSARQIFYSYKNSIKKYLKWAYEQEIIDEIPTAIDSVKKMESSKDDVYKQRSIKDFNEFWDIINTVFAEDKNSENYYLPIKIFYCLGYLGMPSLYARDVKMSDVDIKNHSLKFSTTVECKNDKDEIIGEKVETIEIINIPQEIINLFFKMSYVVDYQHPNNSTRGYRKIKFIDSNKLMKGYATGGKQTLNEDTRISRGTITRKMKEARDKLPDYHEYKQKTLEIRDLFQFRIFHYFYDFCKKNHIDDPCNLVSIATQLECGSMEANEDNIMIQTARKMIQEIPIKTNMFSVFISSTAVDFRLWYKIFYDEKGADN